MDQSKIEQQRRIQEFLNRDYSWRLSAGECNFLIQLIAFLVQANPPFVVNDEGAKEPLNYQSIRSMVLLNEKLRGPVAGLRRPGIDHDGRHGPGDGSGPVTGAES